VAATVVNETPEALIEPPPMLNPLPPRPSDASSQSAETIVAGAVKLYRTPLAASKTDSDCHSDTK